MSDLVQRLRACADDPMWADHAEVPKRLCSAAADEIERQKAVIGKATAKADHLGMRLGEVIRERDALRAARA